MLRNEVKMLAGKRVFITGAGGYIGTSLVEELITNSIRVVRVGRTHFKAIEGVQDIVADIREKNIWSKIVSEADVIYHLAGNTSTKIAAVDPIASYLSTVSPVEHLSNELLNQKSDTRVVFTSTVTVYGLTSTLPVKESMKPNPITVYDEHKLFAENQLLSAHLKNNSNCVILRLANVYGPSDKDSSASDRGILNKVTKMALNGKDLTVYGGGSYIRDYIYIKDVINALLCAGSFPGLEGQVFNIGSGKGRTIREAFEVISNNVFEISNIRVDVLSQPWYMGAEPIELRNFIADIERFRTITKWESSVQFEAGINQMVRNLYSKMIGI